MQNLFWFLEKNFGDSLSPVMFNFLSKQEPIYTPNNSSDLRYVSIGSILNHAKKGDIVWGSGLARKTDSVQLGVDIRSVRGPLTKQICDNLKVPCPEIYGDPALLLPLLYNFKKTKKYKLGIIPHVVDYSFVTIPKKYKEEVLIIDLKQDVKKCVEQITHCERIISSSLHGIIAADAYQIPNVWCKFSNRILGDDTKFFDHLKAVKRDQTKCLDMRPGSPKIEFGDIIKIINDEQISLFSDNQIKQLIDCCPFITSNQPNNK